MLRVKENFKTNPIIKGVTYGIITISLFFAHYLVGMFVLVGLMTLYEFIDSKGDFSTGKDYFYLTVFVSGLIVFAEYVYSNIAI